MSHMHVRLAKLTLVEGEFLYLLARMHLGSLGLELH